ncbi:hypothetical protein [uncultured Sulfuricurvum sp.]|uniref:hypothetical protein n=1 Tax=Sulfuricurvum sp. TaxID=2025608 RepID=UPI002614B1D1|nr:hypothetical protein [uncultured Sulfuricurvum sp.]
MKVFESIRSWFNPPPMHEAPQYGRGIHALPNPKEQELFDEASEGFIHGDTLLGYERFLSSLLHCNGTFAQPHLSIEIEKDSIRFTLIQGYALIRGTITSESLQAHADIAHSKALHVAMKRRFLERNFQLTYCRFSDTDGVVRLSVRLNNATVTPQKIFFPLREIALNADYEKEFIASEFEESLLLDCTHIIPIEAEKTKRYFECMKHWIAQTRQSLVGLLSNDNTGMVSFSYLALLLQIDYLLLPHKKMAKNISEKINGYFMDDEKLTEDKNAELEKYLGELEAMSLEEFSSQLYDSAYTFSPFDQAMHDEIASFIDESLGKVRWYKNNRSNYVISVIYRYISLYILYNYGLHPSLRALLHLHVEVYAADFFKEQGDTPLYDFETRQFQKNLISKRIAEAIEPYTGRYKGLRNFSDSVNYSDLDHFSQSFYLQIKNLDFTES